MNNSQNFTGLIVNNDNSEIKLVLLKILSYFSLVIILIGVIFNTLTFLVIVLNKVLRKTSSMVYLLYVSIFYTLSLLVWNLNHFLYPNFGIELESLNMITCKILTFIQFFSLQSSGFLLTILCIDRYITVISTPGSFASRLPFRTAKSAHICSVLIMSLVFILNSHILILNGKYNIKKYPNSTITKIKFICTVYSTGFSIYPVWENVHLILYSLVPFVIMGAFNVLLIKKISLKKRNYSTSNQKMDSVKKNIQSLLVITFLFLIMTVPTSIAYGFFPGKVSNLVLFALDDLSFLNNSILFFTCFLTNFKFRKTIYYMLDKTKIKDKKPTKN